MCGILGVINSVTSINKHVCDFMRQGFVTSQLRGTDSSGLFQVGSDPEKLWLYKKAVNGTAFVELPEAEQLMRDADTTYFTVGHVRARTQGAVSDANAHPFTVYSDEGARGAGVHNGSLIGWGSKKNGKLYDVDSEWALNHIMQEGMEAFEDISGAYCFVWWDERSPTILNIARNDKRPLHLMFSKDGKRIIYASEAGMLGWLATRVGFDGDGVVRSLPKGKWWKFDVSGPTITFTSEDLPEEEDDYSSWMGYAGNYRGRSTTMATVIRIPEWYTSLANDYTTLKSDGGGSVLGLPDDDADIMFYAVVPETELVSADAGIVERELARQAGLYGHVVVAAPELITRQGDCLLTVTDMGGVDHDAILVGVSKKEARSIVDKGVEDEFVVVGMELDSTIILSRYTRRMKSAVKREG